MAVPALDGAGVALTFAYANYVDVVASSEHVGLQDIAHVHGADIRQAELTQGLLGSNVRLSEVALGGLVYALSGNFAEAQLNCLIAVALNGLLLHYGAGTSLDDGYGNDLAVLIEQLSHAQLFADDTFLHFSFPPIRLLADIVSNLDANMTSPFG